MNELASAIILAIVQGITEWLPVSSSGHLVLFNKILGYKGDLLFDVALHFGTLMSVFVYFGADIVDIIRELLTGKWKSENGRLGILILIATIPAGLIGFLFRDIFESVFSNLIVVAFGFAITGVVLLIASFGFVKTRSIEGFGYRGAIIVGLAQVFSILPGISRSGTTISAGLLSGLKEQDAVKFSFLMSIPVILGANILVIGNNKLPPNLIWATVVSFLFGLLVLHALYKYILTSRRNLRWFGFYALLLALVVFAFEFF
ncbi:MAG: undecaprenyl-diphosphate phosphatase [Nanoarchaeota archaeon]